MAVELKYNEQASLHFFYGDDTTLELFRYLKNKVLCKGEEYFGVLELAEEHKLGQEEHKLLLDMIPTLPEDRGGAGVKWLELMHHDCWITWQHAAFYLAGHPVAVQRFRQELQRRGVADNQILDVA
jgi:hypothetical protein